MNHVAPGVAAGLVLATAAGLAAARHAGRRARQRRRFGPTTRRAQPAAIGRTRAAALARLGRRRRAQRLEEAVPVALEAVARSLRSGAGLRHALSEAAAHGPVALRADLASVVTRTERGEALVDALEGWAARRPSPGVRLAVAALCLGAETGGAQARAVDGVATTLRQRLAAAAEARALAAQARASAAVIALAPIAFCVLASSTDPRVATFLFRSPLGFAVLAAGIALDVVGAWWMARLTRLPA